MLNKIVRIKGLLALILVTAFCMSTMGAVVSDNDGATFITKAEFDSMKQSFQTEINRYNNSIDSKIDGAIAGYLEGIRLTKVYEVTPTRNISKIMFYRDVAFRHQGSPAESAHSIVSYIPGLTGHGKFGSSFGLAPLSNLVFTSYIALFNLVATQARNAWNGSGWYPWYWQGSWKYEVSMQPYPGYDGTSYYVSRASYIAALQTTVNGINNVVTDAYPEVYFSGFQSYDYHWSAGIQGFPTTIQMQNVSFIGSSRGMFGVLAASLSWSGYQDTARSSGRSATTSTWLGSDIVNCLEPHIAGRNSFWSVSVYKSMFINPASLSFSNGSYIIWSPAGGNIVHLQVWSGTYFDSAIFTESQESRKLHAMNAGGRLYYNWDDCTDRLSAQANLRAGTDVVAATLGTALKFSLASTSAYSGTTQVTSYMHQWWAASAATVTKLTNLSYSFYMPMPQWARIDLMKNYNNYYMALAGSQVGLTDGIPLFTASATGIVSMKMIVSFRKAMFKYDGVDTGTISGVQCVKPLAVKLVHGNDPGNSTSAIKLNMSLARFTDKPGNTTTLKYTDAKGSEIGYLRDLVPMKNGNEYDLHFNVAKDDVVWCKLDTPTDLCGPFDASQIVSFSAVINVDD